MARLIFLGTSNAVASAAHENTHLAVVGEERFVLIDCVSSPLIRLKTAGLDFLHLTDLILTHFHPDHISGVPLLLQNMWQLRRSSPLNIYGLHHTLDRIRELLEFFDWDEWPNFFPVSFHQLPDRQRVHVLTNKEFRILASPVRHFIPTLGIRIESLASGKVVAYSCDTEPCPEVIDLAKDADFLIHEAHGEAVGHSSAAQAGGIARQAGAKKLFLIHYPTWESDPSPLVAEASQPFGGPVRLAQDLEEIDF
jgi:ribonuclease Z